MSTKKPISLSINGKTFDGDVEPRLLLSDFIRDHAGLTGTHVGCEHGVCGACTIQLDDEPVRSCLMLAFQAEGHAIRTVEVLNEGDAALHPLQEAFRASRALQCGFCTPGFLMAVEPILGEAAAWDDQEIRESLGGNLCRCTGYEAIVDALRSAAGTTPR